MDVNAPLVKEHRTKNNWTQQHLADICSVSLRTIQRVERYGNASNETVAALASVFEIPASDIVIPETPAEMYEAPKRNEWVSKVVIMVSSTIFGYLLAVMTN